MNSPHASLSLYVNSSVVGNQTAAEPTRTYQLEVAAPQWVEVLVDCPGVQGLYTYSLPLDLQVQLGDIVSVPFGSQLTGGIVMELLDSPPETLAPNRIRPVEDLITSGFFAPTYWQLLRRVADYYCSGLISAIKVALPPGILGRSQQRIRLNTSIIPPGAEKFYNY